MPKRDDRAARLKAARTAEVEVRRRAERAARELEAARGRRDRAAEALKETEDAVTAARESAAQAARELRDAQRAVKRLDA